MAQRLSRSAEQEFTTIDNYIAKDLGNTDPIFFNIFRAVYGDRLSTAFKSNLLWKDELVSLYDQLALGISRAFATLYRSYPALMQRKTVKGIAGQLAGLYIFPKVYDPDGVLSVSPADEEFKKLEPIVKRIHTISNEMGNQQLSTLISPSQGKSSDSKELARLQRLWNTWSGAILEVRQSSIFPITMILRSMRRMSRVFTMRYAASRAIWAIDFLFAIGITSTLGLGFALISLLFFSDDFSLSGTLGLVLLNLESIYNDFFSVSPTSVSGVSYWGTSILKAWVVSALFYMTGSMINHIPEITAAFEAVVPMFAIDTWTGVITLYMSSALSLFLVFVWYPWWNLGDAIWSCNPQQIFTTLMWTELSTWVPNFVGFLGSVTGHIAGTVYGYICSIPFIGGWIYIIFGVAQVGYLSNAAAVNR
jgi:hypothetical protein